MKLLKSLLVLLSFTGLLFLSSCSVTDYYKAAETPGQKAMVVALSPFIGMGAAAEGASKGFKTETKEGRLLQALRLGNKNIAQNLINDGVKVSDKTF